MLLFLYEVITGHRSREGLGRLESRNIVRLDLDRNILADITSRLGCTMLDVERAETTKVYILFLIEHRTLNAFHKAFYDHSHLFTLQAGLIGNLTDDFCFRHDKLSGLIFVLYYYILLFTFNRPANIRLFHVIEKFIPSFLRRPLKKQDGKA